MTSSDGIDPKWAPGSLARYSRYQRLSDMERRKRDRIAREALRKDLEALIESLNGFLAGEATAGVITPMKMHLQVHAVALAAMSERAVRRLKRRPVRASGTAP